MSIRSLVTILPPPGSAPIAGERGPLPYIPGRGFYRIALRPTVALSASPN